MPTLVMVARLLNSQLAFLSLSRTAYLNWPRIARHGMMCPH